MSDHRHQGVPLKTVDASAFRPEPGACVCPDRATRERHWIARMQGNQQINQEVYCPVCDHQWISHARSRGYDTRLPNHRTYTAAVIRRRLADGRLTPEQATALLTIWCAETLEGRRLGWYAERATDSSGDTGWIHRRDEADGHLTLTQTPSGDPRSRAWTLTLTRGDTARTETLHGYTDDVRKQANALWEEAGGGPLPPLPW